MRQPAHTLTTPVGNGFCGDYQRRHGHFQQRDRDHPDRHKVRPAGLATLHEQYATQAANMVVLQLRGSGRRGTAGQRIEDFDQRIWVKGA